MRISKSRVNDVKQYAKFFKVGSVTYVVKRVDEIDPVVLKRIGFIGIPCAGDTITPKGLGPISKFNIQGKDIVHKDQPMTVYYHTVPARDWHGNLADADHVFEHDFDEIEAQIYLERKEYDKLILFCRRNTYQADGNLSKYGKFMPLHDQKEAAEYIAIRTKRCIADCKRSKDYASMLK